MDNRWLTTGLEFPGCEIEESLGVVRGVVVRSRNLFVDAFGQFQTLLGGNISVYASMCEKARADATALMLHQASALGANAVIGLRYESSIVNHASEILCYGTAVRLVGAGKRR